MSDPRAMADPILTRRISRVAVRGPASKGAEGVLRDVLKRCDDLAGQAAVAAQRMRSAADPMETAQLAREARELAFEHAKLRNAKELLQASAPLGAA